MATNHRGLKVGVLALQGAFKEHITCLESLGAAALEVRLPEDLLGLDGLIIPGGESPAIGLLAEQFHLIEAIKKFSHQHAIWGTCAGAILLAKSVDGAPGRLRILDIEIARNAYGRQKDSFIEDLTFNTLEEAKKPYPAIFIRAPIIKSVGPEVKVLAVTKGGDIAAVSQDRIMATSFHPELTQDRRVHKFFLDQLILARN